MVEVVYKYINEFIRDEELVSNLEELENVDEEEKNKLIESIKEIVNSNKSKMLKYSLIYDLLFESSLFNDAMDEMSPKDLMMLITNYLYVPNCFAVSQSMFDAMSKCIIEMHDYERGIILVSTYKYKNINFSILEDEFIKLKDTWYISEYISTLKNRSVTERVIDKIINSKDKNFIKSVLEDSYIQNSISFDDKNKLSEYID